MVPGPSHQNSKWECSALHSDAVERASEAESVSYGTVRQRHERDGRHATQRKLPLLVALIVIQIFSSQSLNFVHLLLDTCQRRTD